ncbi:Clp protease ClpP [Bosea sp. LjRoot90]|uniref:head maturation protease, ClpP-related n=1 Tax=Bosea sp. LjRoot90 TaxID=3342342 RepID=UPI003ED0646A
MSLRKLPEAKAFQCPQGFQWDAPSEVLAKWSEAPRAATDEADNVISILDVIGEDWWSGGGVTAKRISAALRSVGAKDITVRINSPGGDVFEGIAIYNLLRGHQAKVTVEVLGWAASAASIIAMAGDEIRMGLGSFMMVHNSWGVVVGNRHDMRDAADLFDSFDGALVDIYEARTGAKRAAIEKLLDAETFMSASEAVDQGFADAVDKDLVAPPESSGQARADASARERLDVLLAKQGVPRAERRRLLREASGTRDAADPEPTPGAVLDLAAARQLLATMKA